MGIVMGINRKIGELLNPFVNAFYVAPISALVPVMIFERAWNEITQGPISGIEQARVDWQVEQHIFIGVALHCYARVFYLVTVYVQRFDGQPQAGR